MCWRARNGCESLGTILEAKSLWTRPIWRWRIQTVSNINNHQYILSTILSSILGTILSPILSTIQQSSVLFSVVYIQSFFCTQHSQNIFIPADRASRCFKLAHWSISLAGDSTSYILCQPTSMPRRLIRYRSRRTFFPLNVWLFQSFDVGCLWICQFFIPEIL